MPSAAKKKRKMWGQPQRKALRELIDALLVDPTKVSPEDIDPYYKLSPVFSEVVDEEGFRRNFRKFCGIYLQGIALQGVRRGESCHLFLFILVCLHSLTFIYNISFFSLLSFRIFPVCFKKSRSCYCTNSISEEQTFS